MRISCPFLLCPVVKSNQNFDFKKHSTTISISYICLQLCADRERQKNIGGTHQETTQNKTVCDGVVFFFFLFLGWFFFLRRRRRTCETWKCDLIIFLVDNKNGNINNKTCCCCCSAFLLRFRAPACLCVFYIFVYSSYNIKRKNVLHIRILYSQKVLYIHPPLHRKSPPHNPAWGVCV